MSDYGYFGNGSTGYAHYMNTVNQTKKSSGGGGNSGGGCLTTVIMMIAVISAVIAIPLLCIFG